MGQNGVSINHLTEAEWIHNEDYNDWFGYSKIKFPRFYGGSNGAVGQEETAPAQASLGVYGDT